VIQTPSISPQGSCALKDRGLVKVILPDSPVAASVIAQVPSSSASMLAGAAA